MAKFRMPPPDVMLVDPQTGLLTPAGYDLFKGLERLGVADLADVATPTALSNGQFLVYRAAGGKFVLEPTTAPANGQVLIWDDTNKLWVAGAN